MGVPANADARIRSDRLKLLYRQSAPATLLSLTAAGLLAFLLWPHGDQRTIVLWLAVLGLASLVRFLLFVGYRRAAPDGTSLLAWERPFEVSLIASSLVWGVGLLWVMPRDSATLQAVTMLFLVGMAGGALASYSSHRSMTNAALIAILLPAVVWLFATGERTATITAVAMLVFYGAAARSTNLLSGTIRENFELAYALQESKEAAERMASTDALTGLLNRKAFLELAAGPFHFCRRSGLPVAAMMVDLDHFKQVNDTRGHAIGDVALRHVAGLIASALRKSDLSCRWGGEEFVVFLPDTSPEEAVTVGEKLRAAIASTPVALPREALPLTASIGIAAGDRDLETLVDHADAAMYRAKREGRDRVVLGGATPAPAFDPESGRATITR